MSEKSYLWDDTAIGDAQEAPYDFDEWNDIFSLVFSYDREQEGVIMSAHSSYLGNLEVTDLTSSVRVLPGAALVDGCLYTNDDNVQIAVAGSTFYLIGLRKSWAAQTVRIFSASGYASVAAALAALVHTDGTTWEIPLAVVEVSAGAVADIHDARSYIQTTALQYGGGLYKIADAMITEISDIVTFDGIPDHYKDLLLVWNARIDSRDMDRANLMVQMNDDDDSANYQSTFWNYSSDGGEYYGSSYNSKGIVAASGVSAVGSDSNAWGWMCGEMIIRDYRNTDVEKYIQYWMSGYRLNGQDVSTGCGMWISFEAIRKLEITPEALGAVGNFFDNSHFSLFGLISEEEIYNPAEFESASLSPSASRSHSASASPTPSPSASVSPSSSGPQYARPDSDSAKGAWLADSGSTLYTQIDEESYSDADYIYCPGNTISTCKMTLSNVTDPGVSTGHTLRARSRKNGSGSTSLVGYLYCGSTLIASWNLTLNTSYATSTYTLSAAEANAITDYTDLRIWFTGSTGAATQVFVSWFEFEVP